MRSVDQRFYKPSYSDDDITEICNSANIKESRQSFIKSELEHFAAVWRANNESYSGPDLSPHQVSAQLKKVEKLADKLSDLIDSLSNDALRALRRADENFAEASLFNEDRDRTKAGHKITRFTCHDGEETNLVDVWDDLLWSVEAVAAVAEIAASTKRSPIKGPRHSMTNGVWVSNIAALWGNHLNREFTRDVLNTGEPISEARIFCVAAYRILDPSAPRSTILNLMKKHVRNKRKKGYWQSKHTKLKPTLPAVSLAYRI